MDTNLKCPMCGGQFHSQQELDSHTEQSHAKKENQQQEHAISCSKCGLKAKSVEDLKEHEGHHNMNG
ncbi:hypothetical protein HYW42_00640 [Candidatus Daviesbacteria bacterium]|nr:hypothetical protein [Candidatus Daviesbacteria bacterium]